jgi:hypothetical protein
VKSHPWAMQNYPGWSRFYIPEDRYGGVHSLLLRTRITLGSSTYMPLG